MDDYSLVALMGAWRVLSAACQAEVLGSLLGCWFLEVRP